MVFVKVMDSVHENFVFVNMDKVKAVLEPIGGMCIIQFTLPDQGGEHHEFIRIRETSKELMDLVFCAEQEKYNMQAHGWSVPEDDRLHEKIESLEAQLKVQKRRIEFYDSMAMHRAEKMIGSRLEHSETAFHIHCGLNVEDVMKRMMFLAYEASEIIGMGIKQAKMGATEEEVWSQCVMKSEDGYTRANADYVFGRIMKLGMAGCKEKIEIFDPEDIRPERQSWCMEYETCEVLFKKAIEDLLKK